MSWFMILGVQKNHNDNNGCNEHRKIDIGSTNTHFIHTLFIWHFEFLLKVYCLCLSL